MGEKNTQRIAVYAGAFDPVTNGHVDIAERAGRVFDEVHVAVGSSSYKQPLFPLEERLALISEVLEERPGNYVVASVPGLLVDYVHNVGAKVIVRGLRVISDYEYEAQMAMMNRKLAPDIETVFFHTSEECSFINSSIVKEVARYGGDVSPLVPPVVAQRLSAKFTGG